MRVHRVWLGLTYPTGLLLAYAVPEPFKTVVCIITAIAFTTFLFMAYEGKKYPHEPVK